MSADETVDYDSELQRYHAVMGSWDVRPGEHILDIGCGTGQTTRTVARAASPGQVLGIDISSAMIDQARLAAEGIGNVEFVAGDASSYLFGPSSFDAAISRFGTMFFTEPRAAFANIGRALMRGGRLIMLVWRESEHNEWATAIKRSLEIEETNGSLPTFPDAFSLADQSATSSLLIEAGFSGVTFEEASEPVYYGPTISAALDWICSFANVKQALDRKSEGERRRTLDALRNAVGEHESDTGIWFASRAWIVRSHKGLNLDASPDKLI